MKYVKVSLYHRTFSVHQSSESFLSKIKEVGIGKSKSGNPVLMKLDIFNDYFADISVIVGAVHYICDL